MTQPSEKSSAESYPQLDRLGPRLDATVVSVKRLEQRTASRAKDINALAEAFCDYSAKVDDQAEGVETLMDVVEAAATRCELMELEARLTAQFDRQISDLKADMAASAAAAKQDAAELGAWRDWAAKQLASQGSRCASAEATITEMRDGASGAAAVEAAEARMQKELETFAMQFRQAAQHVESSVQTLDRKLQSSVSALSQSIEGGGTHAALQAEQLAEHVKRVLDAGRQRTMNTEAELERFASRLGQEGQTLKEAMAAMSVRLDKVCGGNADVTSTEIAALAGDAHSKSIMAMALSDKFGQETAMLMTKVETLDRRMTETKQQQQALTAASRAGPPGAPPPAALRAEEAEPPAGAGTSVAGAPVPDGASGPASPTGSPLPHGTTNGVRRRVAENPPSTSLG